LVTLSKMCWHIPIWVKIRQKRLTLCKHAFLHAPRCLKWSCPCGINEGVWRSGYISPPIVNLGNRWRWVVSFALRQPYPLHSLHCGPVAVGNNISNTDCT
jgi:hypothetical protein